MTDSAFELGILITVSYYCALICLEEKRNSRIDWCLNDTVDHKR